MSQPPSKSETPPPSNLPPNDPSADEAQEHAGPAAAAASPPDPSNDPAIATDRKAPAGEAAGQQSASNFAGTDESPPAVSESGASPSAPSAAVADPVADPSKIRCFVALNFPVTVVRRIAEEIEALRPLVEETGLKVKWVPAANLHVTLKFLGMIRAASVEAIVGKLRRELEQRTPFELEARSFGAFPSAASPHVVWIGLREQPALIALQQEVERHLEALGFAREERPFHPHVTVGRVAGGSGSLSALASERADRLYGSGRITEIVLYESRTHGRGSEYRALARIALGPR